MQILGLGRFGFAVAIATLMLVAYEVPAFAADASTAAVGTTPQAATITGTVKNAGGAPIAGALVTVSGPETSSTTTAAGGVFSFAVRPGVYRISVEIGGFQPATLNDVAVVAGTSQPLSIVLSSLDLSSLRTIGRVSTSARGSGSTINTGAAASTYVNAQAFQNLANTQINDVLQRIPDVTVQHMGSQQDTAIIVGGLQPYETQVLLDGHPLALGQYGVWLSHLFPSYLVGGVEAQSGPGNTTPFANIAVGGTANITTPGFTTGTTAEFVTGIDQYESQYSNLLVTGSAKKLQYVVAGGTAGNNGQFFKKQGCSLLGDIVQFCGDMSGSLFSRGELFKLKYNFSPTTSLEAGYIGTFAGYSPQGSAWGTASGPVTVQQCDDNYFCSNPNYSNLYGKTITGYTWYPGTQITNTQQLYSAQFRTSLGKDTFLLRPYVGVIQPESYDGTNEGYYPSFFSAAGVPLTTSKGDGFQDVACPPGTIYSFSQIQSPSNTVVSVNGQYECFQYPYQFYEKDKLYGTTFSLIHPFGENLINLTYDFHGQSTFGYANAPSNVTVPYSGTRFSTLSLTGDLHPVRNITVGFGLYDTTWTANGTRALLDSSGNPVLDSSGNVVSTGLARKVTKLDPHLSVVLRSDRNDSFRASWGTSETFPFVGDVSGTPAFQPYAQSAPLYTLGIFTEKSPNLEPETSSAFGVGADHRFANGSVLSSDVTYTTVRNVFQQLTLAENTTFQGQSGVLGIFTPINVATLKATVATLKYSYAPAVGIGYGVSVTADRSILSGIPAGAYNGSPGFPVNNVQVCGNGLFTPGLATCVPYLKSYAHIDYIWAGGSLASLGADYEGKNNSYYQRPFTLLDLTLKHPLSPQLDMQLSVENLLDTNVYYGLPQPGAGVPIVAATSSGLTTYNSTLIPALPRTVRVQLRAHIGK